MYGPDLLIAPVLQSNVTKQRVYLPKGEWVFMWNNATIVAGGQYTTVPSPIGRPPVFYKKSSPFALTFDTIGMTPLLL
jgi:alpha-glucosidase